MPSTTTSIITKNKGEDDMMMPWVIVAPKLKLKSLPTHLKYIYLGEEETLPIIISSKLS